MKEFDLHILTPERPFYEGPCISLTVPVTDGMLGIQAGREPLTAAIKDGEVSITLPSGEKKICSVTRGLLDVSKENVRLICESALAPDEIDEARERAALEEAKLQLSARQSRRDYMMARLAFARAANNLKVKHRSSEGFNQ